MIDKHTKIKIEGVPKEYTDRIHCGPMKAEFKIPRTACTPIVIEAPKKGLISEIIDGEWFWVCGCDVCLGIEPSWGSGYHRCDEHRVCVTCGKHQSELKESPWGVKGGFRCRECQAKIDREQKIEALKKFESENHDDFDFWNEDEIICPHCGTKQSLDDRHESEKEILCETCGGLFDLHVEYSVSYSTSINGERVTLKSVLKEETV